MTTFNQLPTSAITTSEQQVPLSSSSTVVFIDAGVDDYQQLVDGVIPTAEVFVLDAAADGIEQISQVLQQRDNVGAVHIISHGSPGCLYLGNSQLNLETLNYYETQLQQWNIANLLLYGCNVAAGDAGAEFITKFQALTGAEIAASKTLTGSAAKGGNWELEISLGEQQLQFPLHTSVIATYEGLLATTDFGQPSQFLFGYSGGTGYYPGLHLTFANGTTSSITAIDAGWVQANQDGTFNYDNENDNFLTGFDYGGEYRNYFLFDIASFTGQTVTSATVSFPDTVEAFTSDTTESFELFDFNESFYQDGGLVGSGQLIHDDLIAGQKYSVSPYVFQDTSDNQPFALTLSAAAIADLNQAISSANTLFGMGGAITTLSGLSLNDDFVYGTPNKDILKGTASADKINGLAGNDNISGLAGNDTLKGEDGIDILNGGLGDDSMSGGAGNDTYYVDSAGDMVVESAASGTDKVISTISYTLGADVENLTLTGNVAINGTGNTLNNAITGNNASNVLIGDAGNDNLLGNGANDTLNGGNGNDILNGGLGNDSMSGGAGNDTYYVDVAGDVVVESAASGTDKVISTISYTLGADVENLTLTTTAALNGTGNSLNNTIAGNGGSNVLLGDGGIDKLSGAAGDDILNGGAGNDVLTGGTGADDFVFNTGNVFSAAAVGLDKIADFSGASGDDIILSKLTFSALTSVGGSGFSVATEFATVATDAAAATSNALIVYNSSNGSLFYNQNGSAAGLGTGAKFATLTGTPALSAGDFSLIDDVA